MVADESPELNYEFENVWGEAQDPDKRGRYDSFSAAINASLKEILSFSQDEFMENLVENWKTYFPNIPVKPGKLEDSLLVLVVPNATANYKVRPKLRNMISVIKALPGAPANLRVILKVQAE